MYARSTRVRIFRYKITTKNIVRVGIFGAIASILYILVKFPVPFLPPFLEFHFDEVPVLIASFAYGPIPGLCVLLVKTVIKLPFTSSLGVGELSDLIYGAALIFPAAILYKKKRNFKSVLIGLGIGCVLEIAVSLVVNVYVMIPFYMNMMGLSEEAILKMFKYKGFSSKSSSLEAPIVISFTTAEGEPDVTFVSEKLEALKDNVREYKVNEPTTNAETATEATTAKAEEVAEETSSNPIIPIVIVVSVILVLAVSTLLMRKKKS